MKEKGKEERSSKEDATTGKKNRRSRKPMKTTAE